jgi:hypothetical protein
VSLVGVAATEHVLLDASTDTNTRREREIRPYAAESQLASLPALRTLTPAMPPRADFRECSCQTEGFERYGLLATVDRDRATIQHHADMGSLVAGFCWSGTRHFVPGGGD